MKDAGRRRKSSLYGPAVAWRPSLDCLGFALGDWEGAVN